MAAICPHCKQDVTTVKSTTISASNVTNAFECTKCLAWTCPHCETILGMEMDPIEVATKVAEKAANQIVAILSNKIQSKT